MKRRMGIKKPQARLSSSVIKTAIENDDGSLEKYFQQRYIEENYNFLKEAYGVLHEKINLCDNRNFMPMVADYIKNPNEFSAFDAQEGIGINIDYSYYQQFQNTYRQYMIDDTVDDQYMRGGLMLIVKEVEKFLYQNVQNDPMFTQLLTTVAPQVLKNKESGCSMQKALDSIGERIASSFSRLR